ncbi:DUF2637 domain-containing protein [Nonomuraea wenchangensis]|uniref:DUF2637 domain-containing protein n=1 Tax=Nonomuraea wenchangensis TaxID=568860 RepID=A0A1I0H162_9ACTN|nr:DUF2637 domain-containing protein [Nonomuraea wenchangensis]SET77281.1 Protein of unknown function [Nonomuraea wenchangensis]
MRRITAWLLDTGSVLVLALIAGAGSFTHIRDTASEHGQTGWMSWAIAICIDLTCVMAARERQRDKKTGRTRRGPISWPVLVLTGGIVLSLAANLAQATPTVWGWITAATPAGAFLVAVSMLERRAMSTSADTPQDVPQTSSAVSAESRDVPARHDSPTPAPALVDYARRVADEHRAKHGEHISADLIRARLGVSEQLATDLLHVLQPAQAH